MAATGKRCFTVTGTGGCFSPCWPRDAGGYTVVASNFLGMVTRVVANVSISQGPVGSCRMSLAMEQSA
ncbi:MAG TPA: hypothetical protein P5534_00820 [Candidatus Paceibacterota bacterium]|nr:hypothetical protein [Candidatus Paceibacterota bacterium]HRZ55524.1 hypothetical protein [Candidatus Paceibacterota bacterium]